MNLIPRRVTGRFAKYSFTAKQHAPEGLFYVGLVGMGASTVLACRATLRLEEVLHQTKYDLDLANTTYAEQPEKYSQQDLKKDTAVLYVRGVVAVGKLYAPSAIIGFGSIAALTTSHHILKERNLALAAAYTAVDEAFKKYRANVIEKYGADEDRKLRYEHEEVFIVDENGKELSRIQVNPDEIPSQYARFFDETSSEWQKEAEYNFTFLRHQQNWFNDLLRMQGFVFLNDVYKALGLMPSKAGQIVGWLAKGDGDGYIDFGIMNPDDHNVIDFVNGRERSVLLDFNVDGPIYNKLDGLRAVRS